MLEHYWRDFSIAALSAMAFFTLLGGGLATRALRGLPPLVRWLLAPLLGFGTWTGFSVGLFYLVPFTAGRAVAVGAVLVAVVWMLAARPVRMVSPRTLAAVAALGAAMALLPVLTIAPLERDGALFFGQPIFDHMKVALVDAIYRHGVPPVSPYYAVDGKPLALNYYFGWYVVAAALRALPNVSGLVADAALTYCTGWISLLAVAGLAVLVTGKRGTAYLAMVLAIPLGLEEPLSWMFGPAYSEAIGREHGLENWLIQAAWVPQHLFSGATVVLVVLLVVELVHVPRARWTIAPLLGLLASAAVVSSIWAGAFGLAAASGFMLIAVLVTPSARRRLGRAIGPLAVAIAVAALAVAPFLRNLMELHQPDSKALVILWVWPTLERVPQHGPLAYFEHIVVYWTLYAFIQFGAIYLVGWRGLFSARDRLLPRIQLFRRLSMAVIVADLAVAEFLRSVIVNNDLGWRVVLPAVLLLVVWTTAAASSWLDRAGRSPDGGGLGRARVGLATLAMLSALGLVSSVRFATAVFHIREHNSTEIALRKDFRRMPETWAAVRKLTAPHDIVAMNPISFENITSWGANAAAALFSDRPQVVSDINWPRVYSHQVDAGKFRNDFDFVRKIFNGAPRVDDFRKLALEYNVRALLVLPRDALWDSAALDQSPHYRLADDGVRYRVYLRASESERR